MQGGDGELLGFWSNHNSFLRTDRSGMLARIDYIFRQSYLNLASACRHGVPLGFTCEIRTLKAHAHLVHRLIVGKFYSLGAAQRDDESKSYGSLRDAILTHWTILMFSTTSSILTALTVSTDLIEVLSKSHCLLYQSD